MQNTVLTLVILLISTMYVETCNGKIAGRKVKKYFKKFLAFLFGGAVVGGSSAVVDKLTDSKEKQESGNNQVQVALSIPDGPIWQAGAAICGILIVLALFGLSAWRVYLKFNRKNSRKVKQDEHELKSIATNTSKT